MMFHFKVFRDQEDRDLYWGQSIEFEDCITDACAIDKIDYMMTSAINSYVNNLSGVNPLPRLSSNDIDKLFSDDITIQKTPVSPEIALSFMLRFYAIQSGLTDDEICNKCGGLHRNSWFYSCNGTCNPTLKTLLRLKSVFPKLCIDDLFANPKEFDSTLYFQKKI